MSVSGRWATLFHGETVDNDAVGRALQPLRMTPSAGASRRGERGVRAVLASFNLMTQHSVRRLLSERFVLEAKMRAARERVDAAPQPTRDTDDMRKLTVALRDSDYNIKRLVGAAAFPHVLALLGEPDVADSMKLHVGSEEDARTVHGDDSAENEKAARGWRLTLGSVGHRVGMEAKYRYVSHDSPNHKGDSSLVNKLNRRTGEEGLSYFEQMQLRHGRTRRGSCSFAGVHEEVFGPSGEMRPHAEPQPIAKSPRGALGDGGASEASWGAASRPRLAPSLDASNVVDRRFGRSPSAGRAKGDAVSPAARAEAEWAERALEQARAL